MFDALRPALRLLSCTLLLACTLLPAAHADEGERERKQLQQLNREMQQLQDMLKGFKGQRSQLQNKLRRSEVDIGAIQKKVAGIQRQLKQQQQELIVLQGKRRGLKQSQQEQQKFIQQQVLSAYQIGQQKKLKVLLNQQQPDKLSRSLTYYDYFNRARSEQISAYIDIISELDSIEPRISAKTLELQQAKDELSKQHRQLLSSSQQRKQSLNKINASISSKDQRLKKVAQDRQALEKVLAAVEQAIANISIPSDYRPFGQLKGKLPWPVAGRPSNRFGSYRSGGKLRWQGVNIPAREGASVRAIHHGRVVFADWLRGSGLLIVIDHGDGYMSLYAHNQSILAEPGDWVNAGENIASAGKSGGQQQSRLYFEIRHNGKPTDPKRWCKRA